MATLISREAGVGRWGSVGGRCVNPTHLTDFPKTEVHDPMFEVPSSSVGASGRMMSFWKFRSSVVLGLCCCLGMFIDWADVAGNESFDIPADGNSG